MDTSYLSYYGHRTSGGPSMDQSIHRQIEGGSRALSLFFFVQRHGASKFEPLCFGEKGGSRYTEEHKAKKGIYFCIQH